MPAARSPQIPANRLLLKNAAEQLLRWHVEGRIRPHVSDVLPLTEARAALELLLARRSTGKVVLRVDD